MHSASDPVDPSYAQSLVTLLSVIVAIDYADRSALGAVAPGLKDDLGISTAQLGILGGSFGLVGGVSTLVAGAFVDRIPRLRLLGLSALAWSVAMLATGLAQDFVWLLVARSALAVVLATVGPSYPSLVGDLFTPAKRTVAFGRIAVGQLAGGAVGVAIGALAVAVFDWRAAFLLLTVPALFVAVRLLRSPEPPRRGTGHDDPVGWGVVVRTTLRTPTVLRVLLSGSIGAYYLAGASAFSVLFAVAHYGVSNLVADLALIALGIGAVLGIRFGSRLSDALSDQGRASRRLTRAAQGYAITAVAWLPALIVTEIWLALPFLVLGSAALAATIPVLDAVRIDTVAPPMRGRVEAFRTLLKALVEGGAPLAFGLITDAVGNDDQGLQLSFLIALPSLLLAGLVLRAAAKSYDGDRARVLAMDHV